MNFSTEPARPQLFFMLTNGEADEGATEPHTSMFIDSRFGRQLFVLRRLAAATLGCFLLAGCNSVSDVTLSCTNELRSVVRVDVIDSITGAPAAAGSIVWLRSASFSDSVIVRDTLATATATYWLEDRVKAGTYTIEVRNAGYAPWTRSNIRLEADQCHVTTFAFVTARLRHL